MSGEEKDVGIVEVNKHCEVKIRCGRCGTESVRSDTAFDTLSAFRCPSCGAAFDLSPVMRQAQGPGGTLGRLRRMLANTRFKLDIKIDRD